MEPHEQLHWCFYVVLKSLFSLVSVKIFDQKFSPNFAYVLLIVIYLVAFFGATYTALTYEIIVASNAAALLFVSVQIYTKYLCIRDVQSMVDIVDYLIAIYKDHLPRETGKNEMFQRFAIISVTILKVLIGLYVVTGVAYLLQPFIIYWITGDIYPPLLVYFPHLDGSNTYDFILLVLMDITVIVFTAVVNNIFDSFITIVFVNMLLLANIFRMNLLKLNALLEEPNKTVVDVKRQLIHLISEHGKFIQLEFRLIWSPYDISRLNH